MTVMHAKGKKNCTEHSLTYHTFQKEMPIALTVIPMCGCKIKTVWYHFYQPAEEFQDVILIFVGMLHCQVGNLDGFSSFY